MPRTKISEYSTTNSDNTDIESININEGCAPSGINNAIRELMVHLKEFQTGASSDPLTVAGTFVASGGATIAASAGTSASPSIHFSGDTNTGIFSPAADTIAFAEGGTEVMRITSAGEVLIGTTTAASTQGGNLQVITAAAIRRNIAGTGGGALRFEKSRSATDGGYTIVQDGDNLGEVQFYGADGVDYAVAATIKGLVNGTPGSNDMPGALVFSTTEDGSASVTERMRITSAGTLLVGGTTAVGADVAGFMALERVNAAPSFNFYRNDTSISSADNLGQIAFYGNDTTSNTPTALALIQAVASGTHAAGDNPTDLVFSTTPDGSATVTEVVRFAQAGNVFFTKTASDLTSAGMEYSTLGRIILTTATNVEPLLLNRQASDGTLIEFRQANAVEGTISVSGTTVSYNGGNLSRWAQIPGTKDDTLVKGTVMSNLDEMNVYTDAEGNPVDNEQLNKVKVSDVEGDVNVAGVFVNWTYDEAHQVDEINMAMTGDMIIRIAQGVVVQKGDLLMSAGDGTAKPQGDDIVRSKTVAKVTSNHVTCTYADGSYCVPCVLMAC